jgi:hypothetical protein
MNTQTQEALKMASYELNGVIADVEKFDGFDDVCLQTIKRVRSTIEEALEQPAWQGLTDNEKLANIRKWAENNTIRGQELIGLCDAIEQALKEKNDKG